MAYIKQFNPERWIKGIAKAVAFVRFTPRELCISRGIDFGFNETDYGLGEVEEALLQTRSGDYFGLIRYLQANKRDYTAILVDEKVTDVSEILNEIMINLELRSYDILWFDLKLYRFSPSILYRKDNDGNSLSVADFDCYPDAILEKIKLEQSGSEQTYFVESRGTMPLGWTGSWRQDETIIEGK